jgi:hemoglobin
LVIGALALARPLAAQTPADTALYTRLGGVYAIAAVVDYFVDRLTINPTIRANPAVRAAFANPAVTPGIKYRLTELVCAATGGPCTYTGKSMDESHAGLDITAREWDEMVREFQRALQRFAVPAREQRELIAIVATTRADIVVE